MSVDGRPGEVPRAPSRRGAISTTSAWRAHSPPGSIMSIIRQHPSLRLYVDPLLWTPRHLQLLKASVLEAGPSRPHRPSCPQCNGCGNVPSGVAGLLGSYPYRTEKDRNLTRLVRSTIESFRTLSGASLFKTSKQCHLPFSVGGKRQCWVVQALLARDRSSGTPLVAFTHESGRCDAFESFESRSRCAETAEAKARPVTTATPISDINPHDVAVLITMAQEAQRIQSRTQDQIGLPFTVTY
jgi:hypothetical protein